MFPSCKAPTLEHSSQQDTELDGLLGWPSTGALNFLLLPVTWNNACCYSFASSPDQTRTREANDCTAERVCWDQTLCVKHWNGSFLPEFSLPSSKLVDVGMLWISSLLTGESCIFKIIEWATQFANWTLKILVRSCSKKTLCWREKTVPCNAAVTLLYAPEYGIIICITSARKDEKENIVCE